MHWLKLHRICSAHMHLEPEDPYKKNLQFEYATHPYCTHEKSMSILGNTLSHESSKEICLMRISQNCLRDTGIKLVPLHLMLSSLFFFHVSQKRRAGLSAAIEAAVVVIVPTVLKEAPPAVTDSQVMIINNVNDNLLMREEERHGEEISSCTIPINHILASSVEIVNSKAFILVFILYNLILINKYKYSCI